MKKQILAIAAVALLSVAVVLPSTAKSLNPHSVYVGNFSDTNPNDMMKKSDTGWNKKKVHNMKNKSMNDTMNKQHGMDSTNI